MGPGSLISKSIDRFNPVFIKRLECIRENKSYSIITMEGNELEKLLQKFPEKPWDWKWLSANPNITFDYVRKHPEKPWDWEWLSGNPNITFDIVLAYPDKPWS